MRYFNVIVTVGNEVEIFKALDQSVWHVTRKLSESEAYKNATSVSVELWNLAQ